MCVYCMCMHMVLMYDGYMHMVYRNMVAVCVVGAHICGCMCIYVFPR